MPDEVLVKLADGTFVRKPMSEILSLTEVRSEDGPRGGGVDLPATPKTVFQAPSPFRDSGITAVADRIVGQCQIGADDVGSRRLRTFVLQDTVERLQPFLCFLWVGVRNDVLHVDSIPFVGLGYPQGRTHCRWQPALLAPGACEPIITSAPRVPWSAPML